MMMMMMMILHVGVCVCARVFKCMVHTLHALDAMHHCMRAIPWIIMYPMRLIVAYLMLLTCAAFPNMPCVP